MASLFVGGKFQAMNAAGVCPGAKLHTYAAGTLTPLATYTTQSGGAPNTNPVECDANGQASVWLGASAYRMILETSAGVTIWDVDNITSSSSFTASWSGAVTRTQQSKDEDIRSAKDFGALGDGSTDDAAAINAATAVGKGVVYFPKGTYAVASQIVVPSGVTLRGVGFSEVHGTAAGDRGATCILRAYPGGGATVLLSGDDCGFDEIDIDNSGQGTGECLQVTGSRAFLGRSSYRNAGGDGLRIGKTDTGASSVNANCWRADQIVVCGNAGQGMRLDDTNTSTTLSYPLGISNANSGVCTSLDARSNGGDGLQIGNANDNVFVMVTSQSNTGCGIRFKTDGTNAGPRCNKILGNDCEDNTGNDIQIDAATLPVSGPGLYNIVMGNRSVAVSSRIVDNSTGSKVVQWSADVTTGGYYEKNVNAANFGAGAGGVVNLYADVNAILAGLMKATQGTGSGGKLTFQTKRNGNPLADAVDIDQNQALITHGLMATSAAAPTVVSATTIAPTTRIAFMSGTAAVVTITPPAPISAGGGAITFIPTGLFTWTNGGNIAIAGTAVVSKTLTMTYDVTTTKWYPSYLS